MVLLTEIVRGNLVPFDASFTDAAGDSVVPSSVSLHIDFVTADGRDEETIEMEVDTDGSWSAVWDSSVADAGRVYWAVRGDNPSVAQEGFFVLVANRANPDPETTA